jgi:hypothetical protein
MQLHKWLMKMTNVARTLQADLLMITKLFWPCLNNGLTRADIVLPNVFDASCIARRAKMFCHRIGKKMHNETDKMTSRNMLPQTQTFS